MLTKLNFWPEKVYFRLSLCYIHRWMTWWMMTGETNICVIIRKWFATLSKNSSDSASFFEKSTKTEIHWYSIPNFDGASWVTSSISSFRVSKPSHWCLEESALPKKITSTAAVSFYRKTPKNLHIRYSRIQMCIGYCTLVAIWQCYSLMNWETQQSRDLCWEMPDWVNRPKIQICCFYLFLSFPWLI